MKKISFVATLVLTMLLFTQCKKDEVADAASVTSLTKAELGNLIFHNKTLSNPVGQSCASCHDEKSGFADPLKSSVSPGINPG